MLEINRIYQGDCLEVLKKLPEKSINMCMTSPPYWALRDYGVDGQLGLESTFDEYINKLCDIFNEVKRVLRDDGTCWVNLGDTYASGGGKSTEQSFCRDKNKTQEHPDNPSKSKLRKTMGKSLIGIPMRFALEMINRGWILRNTIIWHKPNCMPSSAKDRFTVDFEYIFFFSKKKKYYFETQYELMNNSEVEYRKQLRKNKTYNVKKPYTKNLPYHKNLVNKGLRVNSMHKNRINGDPEYNYNPSGRIKRTTWTLNTKPFKEAHFAVYPEELCETPIKAGCPVGGVVLDPFFGAGTTGLVALKQNKKFVGIELNKDYIEIANKRLKGVLEQKRFV